ncbi:heavy metal translocating P-type ATPase [Anaerobiospirillum succiniciproducens]|uniref:heavy metal translocating P-type ATPase n=1 Tax=Anaerobiospirillum succiniciproducens TaxID=13335 RepID=UPI0023540825|nr:cation-translocating P-type ATPase [Anaerobiospirillum succiniciproducens]MCI6863815.1 cation-translocating P-type ATPase [Anaerobiospirillum succiniciproducens]
MEQFVEANMQVVAYKVPTLEHSLDAARLEAKLRALDGVKSAFYSKANSMVKVQLSDGVSRLAIQKALYSNIIKDLIGKAGSAIAVAGDAFAVTGHTSSAAAPQAKRGLLSSLVSAVVGNNSSESKGDEISREYEEHKRGAISSLLCLGAFELVRRVNPTLYTATSWLRSGLILWMSRDLLNSGIKEAFAQKRPNAETLTVTAIAASIAAGKPESSLSLLAISHFAEGLTTLAAKRARKNISDLVSLDTQEVWLPDADGFERKVSVDSISPGMTVCIHNGEKICVDGEIIHGSAAVDQAAITGESAPVSKQVGDKVFAGTNIRLGDIKVRVEKVGDDTSLARIVHMVEDAHSRRAPIQNYANRMAASLVPVSFIAAAVVYLATRDLQRVLNMLFIDFSCGLKLSTATAMSAAISRLASDGILVKGGSFIEQAASVDTVVLDKTGTITKGRPEINNIAVTSKYDEKTVLALAAAVEAYSSHPMAIAVLEAAKERNLVSPRNLETRNVIARGIEADIESYGSFPGGEVIVGSRRFMVEKDISGVAEFEEKRSSAASSFIYVAAKGELIGVIESSDPIRPDFKRAINRLRYSGVDEIVMLTGDNKTTASQIAKSLGLDRYEAEVMPEDKAGFVTDAQRRSSVLMVGDGVNDAPALAYADVGVAMGSGCTDTAMETADVTINSEDPLKLPEFISLGKRTMRIVQQNFAATVAINTAAMTMGALGFINPLFSSIIHNASTLGVVLNSTRLLRKQKTRE